jgi:hypothetical protein
VTVVPFYQKEGETDLEKTKVVLPAEVDGVHGIFILDTGDYDVDLNRTFLQPSATGGVDSITDANRIPEQGWDTVRVKMRIGTLAVDLDTPEFAKDHPRPGKVVLDHVFGNFSWVFAPRLGNIGVPALAPFETIIDYPHQRVIFIRLDSAGHRMADVPAYTPRATVPLVQSRDKLHWGVEARVGTTVDTIIVDTGDPGNASEAQAADSLLQAVAKGQLPFPVTPNAYGHSQLGSIIGYPFLRRLGVVGFNFRTRQLILYKTETDGAKVASVARTMFANSSN